MGFDFDDVDVDALRRRRTWKWSRYPAPVLPAFVAEMDFAVAAPIRDALLATADACDLGYPRDDGPDRLQALFVERSQRRYGWAPDPDLGYRIPDVVGGMAGAIDAFTEPGEGVIVQPPVYHPFLSVPPGMGRRVVENRLVHDPATGRYDLDLDDLANCFAAGHRLLVLCHPHNPVGRVWSRDELAAIGALACEYDAVVVSDEIHAELTLPGAAHVPFGSLGPDVAARTLTLTSATKAFNLAGVKCGLTFFGSAELLARYRRKVNPDHHHTSVFGIEATRAAWQHGGPWLDALVAHLDRQRDRLAALVGQHLPGVRVTPLEATYLAWLDCRSLGLGGRPAHWFTEQAAVAPEEGDRFGAGGEGFVRLNVATSGPVLTEMLERMGSALNRR